MKLTDLTQTEKKVWEAARTGTVVDLRVGDSEISLQRRLTGPELGRVRATVNDPGVLAAVDHYGMAEYLGAGPEALDKFEKGEITNPVGHALVRAAIDWRRTGLTRTVSEQVLATALPAYLADRPMCREPAKQSMRV